MTLPFDVSRCLGERCAAEVREECKRYLERNTYSPSTSFYTNMCSSSGVIMKIGVDHEVQR